MMTIMNAGTMRTLVLIVAVLVAVAAGNGSMVIIPPPPLLKNINEAAQGDTENCIILRVIVYCNEFTKIFFLALLYTARGEEKVQEAHRELHRKVLQKVQRLRNKTRAQKK